MANKTVTVKPTGGTYTSLALAIAGEVVANANLVTMAGILTISIEGTWVSADTAPVDITGFTTNASYYLKIITDSANRALKTGYVTNRYSLEVTNAVGILNRQNYTRIDGLQIKVNATTPGIYAGIQAIINGVATGADVFISNCRIVQGTFSEGTVYGIYMYDNNNSYGDVFVWNCIVMGFNGSNIRSTYCQTTLLYNCVIYGSNVKGVSQLNANFGNVTAVNCAVFANDDDFSLDTGGSADYCASDDNDGTHNVAESGGGAAWPSDFVDSVNGNFTLVVGSGLIGTALVNPGSGLFSDDMEGNDRGAAWDIGADEYVAAGGSDFTYSPTGSAITSGSALIANVQYFGYKTEKADFYGAGTTSFWNYDAVLPFICPGSGNQNLVSLGVFAKTNGGTPGNVRSAIYDILGKFIAQGSVKILVNNTAAWREHTTFTLIGGASTSPVLVGGTHYILRHSRSSSDVLVGYGYEAANACNSSSLDSTDSDFPSSFVPSGTSTVSYNIRAGVTAAAGGSSIITKVFNLFCRMRRNS